MIIKSEIADEKGTGQKPVQTSKRGLIWNKRPQRNSICGFRNRSGASNVE